MLLARYHPTLIELLSAFSVGTHMGSCKLIKYTIYKWSHDLYIIYSLYSLYFYMDNIYYLCTSHTTHLCECCKAGVYDALYIFCSHFQPFIRAGTIRSYGFLLYRPEYFPLVCIMYLVSFCLTIVSNILEYLFWGDLQNFPSFQRFYPG